MSVRDRNEFRPERRRDELRLVVGSVRLLLDERRDGRSVSSIQRGIDLIEQVEGRRVAALDREYLS